MREGVATATPFFVAAPVYKCVSLDVPTWARARVQRDNGERISAMAAIPTGRVDDVRIGITAVRHAEAVRARAEAVRADASRAIANARAMRHVPRPTLARSIRAAL